MKLAIIFFIGIILRLDLGGQGAHEAEEPQHPHRADTAERIVNNAAFGRAFGQNTLRVTAAACGGRAQ